jgi:hypothetical protein
MSRARLRLPICVLAAGLVAGSIATSAAAAPAPAVAPAASSSGWVTGQILGDSTGMQVAVVGEEGLVTRGSLDADGRFKIAVAAADKPGHGLLLINADGSKYGPVILAHTSKKAYAQMSDKTTALGTIKLVKNYGEVQKTLPAAQYSTANSINIRNGRPVGIPLVFKAVLGKKGTVVDVCIDKPWPRGDQTEGYELIDQLYKEVWGNRTMPKEDWEAIVLPKTWMFWIKNAPREVVATGEFLRTPTCPEDNQWSYSEFFGHEFMNLTNFKSLNQPLNEEGTWTKSIMWKYHRLTYAVGAEVWYITDPEGTKSLIISRDPYRTSEDPVMMPGWSMSKRYTLTKELVFDLIGDDISNIRGNNGDSFQSCPTCPFPDLEAYSS